METTSSIRFSRTRVPLESLAKWFEENKQPEIQVRGLLPVAFVSTIWLADLISNLINIASAMWVSSQLQVPPVYSGLISRLFLYNNAQSAVPAFVQVLVLLLVQGGGIWGLWVLVQRSTWPQWAREGSHAFRPEDIPIRAKPTRKGFAMAIGFLLFWSFLASTLGTTRAFLSGIESGGLKPVAHLQHLWAFVLLLGIASHRLIARGRPDDEATRIRITTDDINNSPLFVNPDETSRPGFPVFADFDPEIRHGLLVIYRRAGTSGPYTIAADEELNLSENDIFIFNLAAWRSRIHSMPAVKFDEGADGLFVAETTYVVPVGGHKPKENGGACRVSQESLGIYVELVTGQSIIDGRFGTCQAKAIRSFIREDQFNFTANQLRAKFASIQMRIKEAGLGTQNFVSLGVITSAEHDSLVKMMNQAKILQEEWNDVWTPAENKTVKAFERIPQIFGLEVGKMFHPERLQEENGGFTDLGRYFRVELHVDRFEFREGQARELTSRLAELCDKLSGEVERINQHLAEKQREQEGVLLSTATKPGPMQAPVVQAIVGGIQTRDSGNVPRERLPNTERRGLINTDSQPDPQQQAEGDEDAAHDL
jgi:hypothetical protein